jgi:hypothetical protein
MSEDLAVRASALPAISPEQMVAALKKYKELQTALDDAMPDQIMDLDGKKFRKKGYWRALALAFNLQVQLQEEKRETSGKFQDNRDNFGWVVTYSAKHPTGREMTGDGSCFAIEKARRFKCPHPESPGSKRTLHFPQNTCPDFDPDFSWRTMPQDATEHNVRSHAHTRAFNRAVSNLVGFGEVSAEEVERDENTAQHVGASSTPAAQAAAATGAVSDMTPTKVKAVDVKNGTKKVAGKPDKPWTRYDVTFEDGRKGNTFSKSDGEHAIRARDGQAMVVPKIEKTEHGFDLKGFIPLDQAQKAAKEEKAAQSGPVQDEPVDGPEDVLVVRTKSTEQGDRFIIQTNKRELVSDQAKHADDATSARDRKKGIVPVFEVVEGATGRKINRLLSFTVDGDPAPAAETAAETAPAEEKAEKKPSGRGGKKRDREPGEEG